MPQNVCYESLTLLQCVVKLPDGRPAADKQITIEATISHGRSQRQFARNYTSDEMGIISFNIPSSIVNEDEEIRLRVRVQREADIQTVGLWCPTG